ncbi:MAG: undecaprenyl-diphosphate phosphatase [Phycisphaerales bacterium]
MTPLQAVVLGVVEGITEYLPISSTGHLIIASSLLGLDTPERKSAVDAFNIVIQGGAILAVVGLYWSRFVRMLRGLMGRDNAGFALLVNLALAFLPAAALGPLLDDWLESRLFFTAPVVTALALGGVFMIVVDQRRLGGLAPPRFRGGEKGVEDLRPVDALLIGLLQCIAMIPGTSRSMMTITGGYFCRLRPAAAAEFSFLLGVPTLGAACVYKLVKNIAKSRGPEGAANPSMFELLGVVPIVIGLVVATVSAALAVKWLVGFLTRRGLGAFGWYRLVLAATMLGLVVGGVVRM